MLSKQEAVSTSTHGTVYRDLSYNLRCTLDRTNFLYVCLQHVHKCVTAVNWVGVGDLMQSLYACNPLSYAICKMQNQA